MSFTARLSPARVSAAAAAAFPRWALFGLLAAYIAAGLFGRDPWHPDDAAGFGRMWTMAHGGLSDWLLPNIAGEFITEGGPLPFWVGAALIVALGPVLGDPLAARLGCVVWLALASAAIWYATYRLTRREQAQPVAFAFGGEATPRDYGRMLADIAVLLLLATLGVVVRMHETVAEPAALAFTAVALLGLAWSLDRPGRGSLVAGLAVGAVALSRGPVPAVWLLVGVVAALWLLLAPAHRLRAAVLAALGAGAVFSAWPLMALLAPDEVRAMYFAAWRQATWAAVELPTGADLVWLLRNGAWFTWPLWPLAAWTVFSWRHALRAPHMAIPVLVFAAMLSSALSFEPVNDSGLMLTVAPLVILATLGATTLRRAADTLMDWFAIAVFSLFALALWAYFIAMHTGTPHRMAASIARLVPGFVSETGPIALALAAGATLAWLILVGWRVLVRPPMMWRGPALAAGGLVMLWALLTLLFMPAINYNRSFAPMAREVARQISQTASADACVVADRLLPSHRALFAFHGPLRFQSPSAPGDCEFVLSRGAPRWRIDEPWRAQQWQLIWEGRRPARADETLRLYRRGG
jgi:4-amino-4-deoxy-L-arabinose transferase-like glycosyltransferase